MYLDCWRIHWKNGTISVHTLKDLKLASQKQFLCERMEWIEFPINYWE